MNACKKAIGIDIGGTKMAAALVEEDGTILQTQHFTDRGQSRI